ncbi:MAG TPA: PQQ-binding-like beta-propeller repeat protein [Pseudomonadales bacterium]
MLECSRPVRLFRAARRVARVAVVLTIVSSSAAAGDAPHPGLAVYQQHCAVCHDDPEQSRARTFDTLKRMIPSLVEYALTQGKMQAQGSALSETQLEDLMNFFRGQTRADNDWVAAALCPGERREVDTRVPAAVSTFGFGPRNHRYLSAEAAGLDRGDLENLELAWTIAFPNITMMRSQPVVVGDTLFITPVDSEQLYAFDIAAQPCVKWVYEAEGPLRSSLTYGELPRSGRHVLVFGGMDGRLHMVDATTGAGIWVRSLRLFRESIITGAPQLHEGRVYASISQFEIMVGADPEHECCKSHGAVAALDGETGETIWLTHTMPEAKPVRDRGDGRMIWGPSGAPVWTSPAIDEKRGVLYVGTGEATSEPAHPHTDSILAVALDDGEIRWAFQATANDIFLAGCRRQGERSPNCPPEHSVERDVDFGASVIIAELPDGRELLLAGQKSSDVWALDPDRQGQVVWHWNNGTGTANGGIHWGMAFDGEKVYAPISDPGRPRPGFVPQPGLYALNAATGELVWEYRAQPDCEGRQARLPYCEFLYGFSAAATVIDRAVVQGSLDGHLRIFDAKTGALLFAHDTARDYQGVNGVAGHGGAIDNASVVAANGLLLVSSGYGMFGQPPGNVLLAFRPVRDPVKGSASVH